MDRKLETILTEVAQWERRIGLPAVPPSGSEDVTKWFNASRAMLRGMSADECGENAILIMQYSYHLQRYLNEQIGYAELLEAAIDKLVIPQIHKYTAYSFAERKLLAINGDAVAKGLGVKLMSVRVRVNRLSYLASKAEQLSRRFDRLLDTKKKQHG